MGSDIDHGPPLSRRHGLASNLQLVRGWRSARCYWVACHSLGTSPERAKLLILGAAALATAAAVAVSGIVGFVGLIVPHIVRRLVGADHRLLLPTAALFGAAFLVLADTVARSASVASTLGELPVGVVTALAGAPFFIYLLRVRDRF